MILTPGPRIKFRVVCEKNNMFRGGRDAHPTWEYFYLSESKMPMPERLGLLGRLGAV